MKKYLLLFVLATIGLFAGCNKIPKDYDAKSQRVYELREKLKLREDIDLTEMATLVEYFDKYGSRNAERPMAYYVYAQCLKKQEELMKAMEYLLQARRICIWENSTQHEIFHAILGNLSNYSYDDGDMTSAMRWAKENYQYFPRKPQACGQLGVMYMQTNQIDSCLYYIRRSVEFYEKCPDKDANFWGGISHTLGYAVILCDSQMANQCWRLMQDYPWEQADGFVNYNAGLYFETKGDIPQALNYYKKALTHKEPHAVLNSARRMVEIYHAMGDLEALYDATRQFEAQSDSINAQHSASRTLRSQHKVEVDAYNLRIEEEKQVQHKYLIWIAATTLALLILAVLACLIHRLLLKKKEELRRSIRKQVELENHLQKALEQLQEKENNTLQEEYREAQERIIATIAGLRGAAHDKKEVARAELERLSADFNTTNPEFFSRLQRDYSRISALDILICILSMHDFGLQEIATLLGYERQQIYQFRSRIYKGLGYTGHPTSVQFKEALTLMLEAEG